MKKLILTILALACAGAVRAGIHTQIVEYKQGDTTLEGFVAYDDAIQGKRPGVLIVHQWLGLTDYEKKRAEMLAQLGYVAFCADIYGKGVRPHNPQEAGAQAGKYKNDRQLLRARANAGLDALRTVRSGLAPGLVAAGSVSGKITYAPAAEEKAAPGKSASSAHAGLAKAHAASQLAIQDPPLAGAGTRPAARPRTRPRQAPAAVPPGPAP